MSSRPKSSGPDLKIPTFEPVPPTNIINRLINKILAPIFYLLFTIITSVIVVPIYTIIQNMKGKAKGRNSRGGEKVATDYSSEGTGAESHGGQDVGGASRNRLGDYVNAYGGTYGKNRKA